MLQVARDPFIVPLYLFRGALCHDGQWTIPHKARSLVGDRRRCADGDDRLLRTQHHARLWSAQQLCRH